MLCIHTVGMVTFDLHGLISCVTEGFLSVLFGSHIVGMGTFDLHELILHEY